MPAPAGAPAAGNTLQLLPPPPAPAVWAPPHCSAAAHPHYREAAPIPERDREGRIPVVVVLPAPHVVAHPKLRQGDHLRGRRAAGGRATCRTTTRPPVYCQHACSGPALLPSTHIFAWRLLLVAGLRCGKGRGRGVWGAGADEGADACGEVCSAVRGLHQPGGRVRLNGAANDGAALCGGAGAAWWRGGELGRSLGIWSSGLEPSLGGNAPIMLRTTQHGASRQRFECSPGLTMAPHHFAPICDWSAPPPEVGAAAQPPSQPPPPQCECHKSPTGRVHRPPPPAPSASNQSLLPFLRAGVARSSLSSESACSLGCWPCLPPPSRSPR